MTVVVNNAGSSMLNVWRCLGRAFDLLVYFGRYGEIVKRI